MPKNANSYAESASDGVISAELRSFFEKDLQRFKRDFDTIRDKFISVESRHSTQIEALLKDYDKLATKIDGIIEKFALVSNINSTINVEVAKAFKEREKDINDRISALEKKMIVIQFVGTIVTAILVSFGKDLVAMLFHK